MSVSQHVMSTESRDPPSIPDPHRDGASASARSGAGIPSDGPGSPLHPGEGWVLDEAAHTLTANAALRPAPAPRADAPGARVVALLEEDDDLAASLPATERRRARALLRAALVEAPRGEWLPPLELVGEGWGLLVLDGLIARRVVVAGAAGTELLGPGDLVTPPARESVPAFSTAPRWELLRPVRVAVLDGHLSAQLATWPQLGLELVARGSRRADRLAQLLAISHLPRLEDRILATLWYLAGICGHVTSRGVSVSVGLTHHALGELAGAKRPTVTLALRALRDRGLVVRRSDGSFLLCEEPPRGLGLPILRVDGAAPAG